MRFVVIGSSTPLQKLLPEIAEHDGAEITHVFLDPETDTAVRTWCEQNAVAWSDSATLKSPTGLATVVDASPDWIINIYSTVVLPEAVLAAAAHGALNFHPGKLPEYAGLHCHQWAIRNREDSFGVTIHWMEAGIDTGDIAYAADFPVKERVTGLNLFLTCINEGTPLMAQAIDDIMSSRAVPRRAQDPSKRKLYTAAMAADGAIDWSMSAAAVDAFVRAADYAPFSSPTYVPTTSRANGQALMIRKARVVDSDSPASAITSEPGQVVAADEGGLVIATGAGLVRLTKIEAADGSRLTTDGFTIGEVLGS